MPEQNQTQVEVRRSFVEVSCCVRIRAPHWYARQDFQTWRRDPSVAGWGKETRSLDPAAHDYSDVFMTFEFSPEVDEDWEGSNNDLPENIYQEIGKILRQSANQRHGVIWIST